jgi:hypothetical protein
MNLGDDSGDDGSQKQARNDARVGDWPRPLAYGNSPPIFQRALD